MGAFECHTDCAMAFVRDSGWLGFVLTAALAAAAAWMGLGCLRSRKRVVSYGRSVLITGCDTGFGKGLAYKLLGKGYKVFAACYTQEAVDSCGSAAGPGEGATDHGASACRPQSATSAAGAGAFPTDSLPR